RLPGLCVGSDKMVSTTSKMMDITLMPILAAVYNGHREPLTVEEGGSAHPRATVPMTFFVECQAC
ncbi:hypothetical protein, partial [Paraburkholderia sp. BR14374]|uniref:hypothetical protein n=1 Tax=Paraburkholderia sp. BR14374 TaxID=3237007 RepID=UPI0034CE181E